MTTDNRTNEPSEAQVEAAAKAIWDIDDSQVIDPPWDQLDEKFKRHYRTLARAALVAAQVLPSSGVDEDALAEGWSNDDANAAFEEADNRFGNWRGGERHEFADGCYNGFKLGAEWQKARETFISYKAIADEARAERDAALAAIERVRAAIRQYPNYGARFAVEAALDGAPEPEVKP